ncbi:hypothetical protein [Mycolicibacterium sp. CBMA 226]|uniref:hypothetical protein n=1 Tax=Mycolicibacterium sp. CBMA 226 TaxID=2606611 RepID=UPI0012DF4E99|nr:hypothetical protein [Mycolicibacterium sp. CBMA 226]MUL75927.1 hypothetical protein [Mycolicibacterium sp. CBMA 226]
MFSQICYRFDGEPLAIEFAAAQAPALSPVEILDRLHEGSRFDPKRRSMGQPLRASVDGPHPSSESLSAPGEPGQADAVSLRDRNH